VTLKGVLNKEKALPAPAGWKRRIIHFIHDSQGGA